MKKDYVRPTMIGERFVANEYISTCSDTKNEYYKFVCDAGGGNAADIYEGTYKNFLNHGSNLTPGWEYFHSCGITHYVKKGDSSPFVDGWYDSVPGIGYKYEYNVVIWKGKDGKNVHATKSLKTEIETIKGNKS